jgi:signal peptidase II
MALTAAAVLAADRATKAAAVETLRGRPPRVLFGGILELVFSENTGGFLSLGGRLPPAARYVLFVLLVGAGLVAASVWVVRSRGLSTARSVGAAAMIAGGASNLVDRVLRGRVVDFAILRAGPLHTGVFNLADAAVLGGAVLWLWPAFGTATRMERRSADRASKGGQP